MRVLLIYQGITLREFLYDIVERTMGPSTKGGPSYSYKFNQRLTVSVEYLEVHLLGRTPTH